MKHLISFLALIGFMLIAGTATSQESGYMLDTLESSSSIDTVDLYPGGDNGDEGAGSVTASRLFQPGGVLTVLCKTDSLSGSTNATMVLQYGHTSSPDIWYDATTTTLNGAAVQTVLTQTTTFGWNRWRIRAITASGTQNTRIKCSWSYSRKPH